MRLPGMVRLGITTLCLGIVVFGIVHYWVNTRTLVPLDIPVTLAPGHIRTGDFNVNVDAYFSVEIRFPYTGSSGCRYADDLRTRQLTAIGSQVISSPAGANGGITNGTYLGSFQGKPGHYNLDIEVLSPTHCFAYCWDLSYCSFSPRLTLERSPLTSLG